MDLTKGKGTEKEETERVPLDYEAHEKGNPPDKATQMFMGIKSFKTKAQTGLNEIDNVALYWKSVNPDPNRPYINVLTLEIKEGRSKMLFHPKDVGDLHPGHVYDMIPNPMYLTE